MRHPPGENLLPTISAGPTARGSSAAERAALAADEAWDVPDSDTDTENSSEQETDIYDPVQFARFWSEDSDGEV